MKFYSLVILSFTVIFLASCGVNLFSPFSAKDYPEANQYQSITLIDQGRYAEVLSNADKYPPQDHVVAALGIMGFDVRIITNLLRSGGSESDILLSWIDTRDKDYVLDLSWGLSRLREEFGSSLEKSLVFSLGGMAVCMVGLLILADIANTNAIDTSDGLSDAEFDVLSHWLSNPPENITNIFREVGKDRMGNRYTIARLIGGGVSSFLLGYGTAISLISTNISLSEISNVFSSIDGNGDGDVSDAEVSNFIISFISNIVTNF